MSIATVDDLVTKLSPNRINCSGKFTAMLAFLLDQHGWTDPEIVEMAVTSDDMLLVGTTDDPLLDAIEGNGNDLMRNLRGVAKATGLSNVETTLLLRLAETRVTWWHA